MSMELLNQFMNDAVDFTFTATLTASAVTAFLRTPLAITSILLHGAAQ